MEIPAKVLVPSCIEQGSIYHYHIDKINKNGTVYSGDRFFVVLNVNPVTDRVLIMATMTTQIEN